MVVMVRTGASRDHHPQATSVTRPRSGQGGSTPHMVNTHLTNQNRRSHGEGQEPDQTDHHVGVASGAQILSPQREQNGDVPEMGGARSVNHHVGVASSTQVLDPQREQNSTFLGEREREREREIYIYI